MTGPQVVFLVGAGLLALCVFALLTRRTPRAARAARESEEYRAAQRQEEAARRRDASLRAKEQLAEIPNGLNHSSIRTTPGEQRQSPSRALTVAQEEPATGSERPAPSSGTGSVWAWGSNYAGQLGDGTPLRESYDFGEHYEGAVRAVPVPVRGLTDVVTMAALPFGNGQFGTAYAVTSDGAVSSWGESPDGILGDGSFTSRSSPRRVPGLGGITTVSACGPSVFALDVDGVIWAWGNNDHGQLGDGTKQGRSRPKRVHGLNGVVAVTGHVGMSFTDVPASMYALRADGSVWAWGWNYKGRLGEGTTEDRLVPVQVAGLSEVTSITVHDSGVHAVRSDGTVWAWGSNSHGQLGDGTKVDHPTPVPLPNLANVSRIEAGADAMYALRLDGTVWSWGFREHGQLGDGLTGEEGFIESGWPNERLMRAEPGPVLGLSDVVAVVSWGRSAWALKSDRTVWAWGGNEYGQLGDGTELNRSRPVQMPGLTDIISVMPGSGSVYALKSDGTVSACGSNDSGQLGDGTTVSRQSPVRVADLEGVGKVFPGSDFVFAVIGQADVDSARMKSGWRSEGEELGRDLDAPEDEYPHDVVAVAAGGRHCLALTEDGTVTGWGANNFGQAETPTGLSGVRAIAAGNDHSVALKSDGTVVAWGSNLNGQTEVPAGLRGVRAIAAGGEDSVAILADGSAVAWGAFGSAVGRVRSTSPVTQVAVGGTHFLVLDAEGDVGGVSTPLDDGYRPVSMPAGLRDVEAVAAGSGHCLALKRNGTVVAWGRNDYHQADVPPDLRNVVAIAAGGSTSMALKADGSVVTWGYGRHDHHPTPSATGPEAVGAVAAGGRQLVALRANGTLDVWNTGDDD